MYKVVIDVQSSFILVPDSKISKEYRMSTERVPNEYRELPKTTEDYRDSTDRYVRSTEIVPMFSEV